MLLYRKLSLALGAGFLVVTLGGCEQEEGPAESAGRKIDEAVEELAKKEGPGERAGEKIDEAVQEAGDAMERAGEKMQEATE